MSAFGRKADIHERQFSGRAPNHPIDFLTRHAPVAPVAPARAPGHQRPPNRRCGHATFKAGDPIAVRRAARGRCRGFRNISDEEDILQVIISGGVHDMNDIDFAPQCAEEIARIQPGLRKFFEGTGLTFTASKDAPE